MNELQEIVDSGVGFFFLNFRYFWKADLGLLKKFATATAITVKNIKSVEKSIFLSEKYGDK